MKSEFHFCRVGYKYFFLADGALLSEWEIKFKRINESKEGAWVGRWAGVPLLGAESGLSTGRLSAEQL